MSTTTRRKLLYHLRPLDSGSCELYILWEGDRPGWDDEYMGTYWSMGEARTIGEAIVAAPPGTTVDLLYGRSVTIPA